MNKSNITFLDLSAYKKSKFLCKQISRLIKISNFEKYLNLQLRKSSLSIILHIAEGSSQIDPTIKSKLYLGAKSSVFECIALLEHLYEIDEISAKVFQTFLLRLEEISLLLLTEIKQNELAGKAA